MTTRKFSAKEIIFKQGAFENVMYSVVSGSVDIYTDYEGEKEKKLASLSAGQFFGEIGLIDVCPRTATAVAGVEGAELEVIDSSTFADYLQRTPGNVRLIMSNLSQRIRNLTEDFAEISRCISALENEGKEEASVKSAPRFQSIVKDFLSGKHLNVFSANAASSKAGGSGSALVKYGKGDIVFREGDEADCMYDVLWGTVGIYSDYGKPSQKLLTTVYQEGAFGEMGVLDELPRSATAVCHEACNLRRVSGDDFEKFFTEKPRKILAIIQRLGQNLNSLTKKYLEVCRIFESMSQSSTAYSADDANWKALRELSDKL